MRDLMKFIMPRPGLRNTVLCLALVHIIAVDIILFTVYWMYSNTLKEFNFYRNQGFNSMYNSETVRRLVVQAKNGGLASLERNTIKRFYMDVISDDKNKTFATFGIDVSNAGEALYIRKRMYERRKQGFRKRFSKIVVDIGANDGVFSSNSYNFIQWGWSAILVEPNVQQLIMAKRNLHWHVDPYNKGKQFVTFVDAAIGTKDGREDLIVTDDAQEMESHLSDTHHRVDRHFKKITVKSYTPKTFAQRFKVPKYFGILSIDTEGVGAQVLHGFIDAGYRPMYVIYEPLHNAEAPIDTVGYMKKHRYKYLNTLGWNQIYEFQGGTVSQPQNS